MQQQPIGRLERHVLSALEGARRVGNILRQREVDHAPLQDPDERSAIVTAPARNTTTDSIRIRSISRHSISENVASHARVLHYRCTEHGATRLVGRIPGCGEGTRTRLHTTRELVAAA